MASEPNAEVANDIQGKFELYFATLIFTILGLAIQTAKPSELLYPAICETASWACLFLAGILALKRISWSPTVLHGFAEINRKNLALAQLEQNIGIVSHVELTGVNPKMSVKDAITWHEDQIKKIESHNRKTNSRIVKLFKVQFALFIIAIVLLIYSRGYENILLIYKNWLPAQHTEIKLCFSTFETCLKKLKL